jgi:hypothetical protein
MWVYKPMYLIPGKVMCVWANLIIENNFSSVCSQFWSIILVKCVFNLSHKSAGYLYDEQNIVHINSSINHVLGLWGGTNFAYITWSGLSNNIQQPLTILKQHMKRS